MNFIQSALQVITIESQAIMALAPRIDCHFEAACQLILACQGRVFVMGMGKSGHIGKKIAATFSSTGTPAFFMHPGEASHGDFGMITRQDIVIAISNSGNTSEIMTLLPLLKRLEIPLIAFSGNPQSALSKAATVAIDLSIQEEACPLGLAPTTSSTVALVMGDALAVALLEARGFSAEDFALAHPGGALGKRLLLRVGDLCHRGNAVPIVGETSTIREALLEVSEKKLGMTCVINSNGELSGIYTDGDVRRTLVQDYDIVTTKLIDVMTHHCHTTDLDLLAAEAVAVMQKHNITSLVICDDNKRPIGVLHIHDLLHAGVI
jgi:arabinose-5-phosphate isomerase